jgi:hypothetical protein
MEKEPLAAVWVPVVLPLIETLTPESGKFSSEATTRPEILLDCAADTATSIRKKKRNERDFLIFKI